MYKIKEYSPDLDLSDYYRYAHERGFYNNDSREKLVDTWLHMNRWNLWFVYYGDKIVGSVVSHSLEELGILGDAYRIAVRTCSFDDLTKDRPGLRTANAVINRHQTITGQLLLPLCIEWAGRNKDLYISSNENDVGTQKIVHRRYCPGLQKIGVVEPPIDLEYRGAIQSFWKFNANVYYEQLKHNQWQDAKEALISYLGYNITES
jgi:hypothetical protein